MKLLDLLITAIALSMDALAVSIGKGLSVKRLKASHCLITGAYFGGFQALMPLLGFLLASSFASYIQKFDHWIACVLLVLIGANMLREAFSKEEEQGNDSFSFRVMLPLSKPVLMVIAIFTINASWSDFFWPYLVLGSRSELYTVMVKIFYMAGSSGYSEDIQVVALIFTIIPPTILFLFFQRYIMSGFTLSGIKG